MYYLFYFKGISNLYFKFQMPLNYVRSSYPIPWSLPDLTDEYVIDSVSLDGQHTTVAIWHYDKRQANEQFNVYYGMTPLTAHEEPAPKCIAYVDPLIPPAPSPSLSPSSCHPHASPLSSSLFILQAPLLSPSPSPSPLPLPLPLPSI